MRRTIIWCIITCALGCLCVALLAAEAQQAPKVYQVGFLSPGFPRPDHAPPC